MHAAEVIGATRKRALVVDRPVVGDEPVRARVAPAEGIATLVPGALSVIARGVVGVWDRDIAVGASHGAAREDSCMSLRRTRGRRAGRALGTTADRTRRCPRHTPIFEIQTMSRLLLVPVQYRGKTKRGVEHLRS